MFANSILISNNFVFLGTAGTADKRSVAPYTTSLSEGREKKPCNEDAVTSPRYMREPLHYLALL